MEKKLLELGFSRWSSTEYVIAINKGQFHVFPDEQHSHIKWYPNSNDLDEGFWMPIPHLNEGNIQSIVKAITNTNI